MVPPATALTQNKAICTSSASHGGKQYEISSARSSHRRAAAAVESVQQRLQGLAFRGFAGVGPEGARGHDTAGGSFKEALMRQWAQCCSFVAAAAVFEKRRALVRC